MPTYIELDKQVLRYVSGTLELGLKFDGEANTPDDVIGYTDSDFAGSKQDRKSTGSYFLCLQEPQSVTRLNFNLLLQYLPMRQNMLPFVKQEKRPSGWDICWLSRNFRKVYPGHIIH